jgi:DNA-directed RNA polymerase specialized sigma24 family protein
MAQDIPQPRMLRGDEANLYRDHSAPLRAAVRHFVCAGDEVVDDACSFAWLQLMRHQPNRDTGFAWLRTIAERDARERTIEHLPLEDEPRRGDLSRETEARDALRALAALPARERSYLAFLITGHSYNEIARHHRVTRSAVNRHIARGRRHLRLVRDDT